MKLYAMQALDGGGAGVVGEVVSESKETVRIECIDTIMAWCGVWLLSGEIRDIPRTECRLFNDTGACLQAAIESCNAAYAQAGKGEGDE